MNTRLGTPSELLAVLGDQVRRVRLMRNLSQQEVAARAAISVAAIKRLENGKGATLGTLVATLRVLDRTEWLRALAPAVSVSPLQVLESKSPRRRARARK